MIATGARSLLWIATAAPAAGSAWPAAANPEVWGPSVVVGFPNQDCPEGDVGVTADASVSSPNGAYWWIELNIDGVYEFDLLHEDVDGERAFVAASFLLEGVPPVPYCEHIPPNCVFTALLFIGEASGPGDLVSAAEGACYPGIA